MTEQLQSADQPRYMKGRSRHLFWPYIAFIGILAIAQYLQNALIPTLMKSLGADGFTVGYSVLAIGIVAAGLLGSAAFLLAYALKTSVKTYKVLFIVLAVMQLPAAFPGVISALRMIDNLAQALGGGFATNQAINITSGVIGLLVTAAWITCMAVIIFSKHSNTVVRISAVSMAVYYLYSTAYYFVLPYVIRGMLESGNYSAYSIFTMVMSILNNLVYIAVMAFFFASVSFGKQRKPKPAAAGGNAFTGL